LPTLEKIHRLNLHLFKTPNLAQKPERFKRLRKLLADADEFRKLLK
jgi:hypothetical protein